MAKFTKKDLMTGDFVITRCGQIAVVLVEKNAVIYERNGYSCLSNIQDDLSFGPLSTHDYDIMKVCRSVDCSSFDGAKFIFKNNLRGIIYDREKVEKEKVEEMTMEQICKALGKNVKIVKEHDHD